MSEALNLLKKNGDIRGHKRNSPLWHGPCGDPADHMVGVTFSLLSKFLVCRERFRISVIEGIQPRRRFDHKIEFGQMWHVCEEFFHRADKKLATWEEALKNYAQQIVTKYPDQVADVNKWYQVTKRLFPHYITYWKKHPDMLKKQNVCQEEIFSVPYKLPSGRVVVLKGKIDSADIVTKGNKETDRGLWVQENKTKGTPEELQIIRQLGFDLQTGIYLAAVRAVREMPIMDVPQNMLPLRKAMRVNDVVLRGVRYNVIRRPLASGRHCIRPHKATKNKPAETLTAYYDRLEACFKKEPSFFFMRWNVKVTDKDLDKFCQQCLDPILEQLCDWYAWISNCVGSEFQYCSGEGDYSGAIHWRHPFGVFNVLNEGGATALDNYLATGSMVGLERVEELFTELR